MTYQKYGYMCEIAFDCELGNALGGNKIYPDKEDLIENHPCADNCGIVRVVIMKAPEDAPS